MTEDSLSDERITMRFPHLRETHSLRLPLLATVNPIFAIKRQLLKSGMVVDATSMAARTLSYTVSWQGNDLPRADALWHRAVFSAIWSMRKSTFVPVAARRFSFTMVSASDTAFELAGTSCGAWRYEPCFPVRAFLYASVCT